MARRSWVEVPDGSPFGPENLPYGVFSHDDEEPRVGVRIGDHVLDLAPLLGSESLEGSHLFQQPSLNAFMAVGRPAWRSVRSWLTEMVTEEPYRPLVEPYLVPLGAARLHRPFDVADYVDFYCSRQHATNVGRIFRPDAEPLLPNWRHLPVGYHGRAGTVVVSGTPVTRPCGQRKPADAPAPTFGPSGRLDVEVEVGFVVGTPSRLGEPVPTGSFADHVFGVVLVNDWSARDLQAWEYQPLGPFLAKSFATSISPWVVPLDALAEAWVPLPGQEPEPLPYLRAEGSGGLDLALELRCNGAVLSRPPYRSMYWSPAQMLAHLTVNGAALRTGDLFASGTVSGDEPDQLGSLLELSWGGRDPVRLVDGQLRTFLEDGDEVVITGTAPGRQGCRIGLGEVSGRVAPASCA